MRRFLSALMLILTSPSLSVAAASPARTPDPEPEWLASPVLQQVVDRAIDQALERFEGIHLKRDQLAVTLVDLSRPDNLISASHRGQELVYPASVVKLFYLVAIHEWLERGRLQDTAELRRAMHDMIVFSYNEATHYIVDLLTGTTSGPELADGELEIWHERRNAVNRYFSDLGYRGINVNKKPWCEGPYGRETQAIQRFEPTRNWLTTEATARLLCAIFLDRILTPARCADMRKLLHRELHETSEGTPDAGGEFIGPALPRGSELWSKAGWTSQTRHDATCIALPNGRRVVLVIFTVDHAGEAQIIPTIARTILNGLP